MKTSCCRALHPAAEALVTPGPPRPPGRPGGTARAAPARPSRRPGGTLPSAAQRHPAGRRRRLVLGAVARELLLRVDVHRRALELRAVQPGVGPAERERLVVIALLDAVAVLQHAGPGG